MSGIERLACAGFILALSACDYSGAYDSNGTYVTPSDAQRYHDASDERHSTRIITTTSPNATVYNHRGYYDYYGNYITLDNNVGIPQEMMPPPGMCRVWLPNREASRQPGIDNCEGIRSRVPIGAYVIYGG